MQVLGIDIGGTTIKTGLFNEHGECFLHKEIPTQGDADETVLDYLIKEIEKLLPFDAIGISVAGMIDAEAGVIVEGSVNIPGMDGIAIKEVLEKQFKVPVEIQNDVNAAALGENAFGVGKGHGDFLFLAYGTGVGGAIIHQSQLFSGQGSFAGEFGHMITHGNGRICNCGMNGCYERYASTAALIREAEKINPAYSNGRLLFEQFHAGDEQVKKIISDWVDEIAIGLASLIHCFNPSTIIVGGGIMEQDVLIHMIQERIDDMIFNSFKEVTILKASLGNKAGMLGAISLHTS